MGLELWVDAAKNWRHFHVELVPHVGQTTTSRAHLMYRLGAGSTIGGGCLVLSIFQGCNAHQDK
jgi:hypothetical protein